MVVSQTIDVSGAQHLAVNVAVNSNARDVERMILFGHEGPGVGGLMPLQTDFFTPTGQLFTLVPVHGPRLQVTLENKGSQPATVVFATVYGVRKAP